MAVFLWYSKSSQETGAWLANRLKIEQHGTKPPRDFQGSVVCWGAAPSEKFRWEKRNFQAIFNDPRVIRPIGNRDTMFKKLNELDMPTIKFLTLPVAEVAAEGEPQPEPIVHSYADLCVELGVTEEVGFITCTPKGFKKVPVKTQGELDVSIEDGRVCVTVHEFAAKERIRIFVANGSLAGASKYSSTLPAEGMAGILASSISSDWSDFTQAQCAAVLQRAIDKKLITATGGTWAPFSLTDANLRNRALTIASALKFDFCAVDIAADGSGTIINIITTPNLREVASVQSAITNAVASWVYTNTRTAKDILLEAIKGSTVEEASSLLEELSSLKGTIKLALKKEVAGTADEVDGGADSPPTESVQ